MYTSIILSAVILIATPFLSTAAPIDAVIQPPPQVGAVLASLSLAEAPQQGSTRILSLERGPDDPYAHEATTSISRGPDDLPRSSNQGAAPSREIAATCAGFSQEKMLFTSTRRPGTLDVEGKELPPLTDDVLRLIADAVKAAGGSVTHEYSMEGFKGFAITAPTKVLALLKEFGKTWDFDMKPDGTASTQVGISVTPKHGVSTTNGY